MSVSRQITIQVSDQREAPIQLREEGKLIYKVRIEVSPLTSLGARALAD